MQKKSDQKWVSDLPSDIKAWVNDVVLCKDGTYWFKNEIGTEVYGPFWTYEKALSEQKRWILAMGL